MAAPDLDVIKEIPGYKVILKAVVKSQIQLLVEQLAAHTDEESIILTASVADGTLSHLGSESGKSFLEDHEDVKSQFLGFCLKYQHKKKQEKEKERLEQELQQKQIMLKQQMLSPQFSSGGPSPHFMPSRSPRHYSSRYPYGPGARHEPYHVMRPNWRSLNLDRAGQSPVPSQSATKPDGQVIKIEPNDSENSDQSSSETATNVPNTPGSETEHKTGLPSPTVDSANKDNDASESESSAVNPEGLDSEIANLISGGETASVLNRQGSDSQTQDSEIDPNVSVKFEAVTEHEMDLEITGVEPGRPGVPQDDWTSNMSMDMNFDPLGATGSQADLQGSQQGYTTQPLSSGGVDSSMNTKNCSMYSAGHNLHYSTKDDTSIADDKSAIRFSTIGGKLDDKIYTCAFCGKGFCRNWLLKRHLMIHTGEKPFHCNYCGKRFNQLSSLKKHFITHMNQC